MKEERSASQILFGFLPEQTVDLRGRIWKVKSWQDPLHKAVDLTTIKRELRRQAAPWAAAGTDNRYSEDLLRGRDVEVLSLNLHNGVKVEPFPEVWMCKVCRRLSTTDENSCRCGQRRWGQLPFIGYHECGAVRAPFVPTCPEHSDVRIELPGTSSAAEIKFICPVCSRVLRKGFGFPKCSCGRGRLTFNVHRAASAYTPRTVVVVNPPSPERMRELAAAGGGPRALEWLLRGFDTPDLAGGAPDRDAFQASIKAQGLSDSVVEELLRRAEELGEFGDQPKGSLDLRPDSREQAEAEAVTVALALSESRVQVQDLIDGTTEWSPLGTIYRTTYPMAISRAGLEAVELSEKFPVLTGNFAYTRGAAEPGKSYLVPFRNARGRYVVYADIAETEALFVRLMPSRVASWLEELGTPLPDWDSDASARRAILQGVRVPAPGDDPLHTSAGSMLLQLIHSYAHRFIRRAAVFAGIERSSLSELLVPHALGFFVYAAARGDFVLGGLQALFETELHNLLEDFVDAEQRCPLDPGCERSGAACMACLHLGEPSCRFYNQYLDRRTLVGPLGFVR